MRRNIAGGRCLEQDWIRADRDWPRNIRSRAIHVAVGCKLRPRRIAHRRVRIPHHQPLIIRTGKRAGVGAIRGLRAGRKRGASHPLIYLSVSLPDWIHAGSRGPHGSPVAGSVPGFPIKACNAFRALEEETADQVGSILILSGERVRAPGTLGVPQFFRRDTCVRENAVIVIHVGVDPFGYVSRITVEGIHVGVGVATCRDEVRQPSGTVRSADDLADRRCSNIQRGKG